MNIIACLGNPGKKYAKNRHNIGIIIGEHIAKEYNISVNQKVFSSFVGNGKIDTNDILLLVPDTYMNNSGIAVQKALQFYKEDSKNLIVIHDEIELPFGDYRNKFGGGHKGHNGLRSIIQHIGTPDFHRIRFGVGRPEHPDITVADYVLSNFTQDEMIKIDELYPQIRDLLISIINQ